MDNKRKITAKVYKKALIAILLIGCFALPIIGGIKLVHFAGARPASDEGQIAFIRNNCWCIWVMDADGKNEQQLTTGINEYRIAWSPDGRQIAFSRWIDKANRRDIYIMNVDGSNIKRLTDSPENNITPTWSPDGKHIAFVREVWEQEEMKGCAIYVMNADGSNVRSLGEDPTGPGGPAWSPDGGKIAYCCWAGGGPAVWVMDANGENQKMLNSGGGRLGIDWSPDGDKIVFESMKDSMGWESNDIYIMNADGTGVNILTQPGPAWYDCPVWSPDGTKIAFGFDQDGKQGKDIYVMNADGSDVQRLTNTPANEFGIDWTASSYTVEPTGKLKTTWGNIKHANYLESRTND